MLHELAAHKELKAHRERLANQSLASLFTADKNRASRFTQSAAGITLDYSKNRFDDATLQTLFELAQQANVAEMRTRMFRGDAINHTENRAVLHTALRNRGTESVVVDGRDVMPDVRKVLAQMHAFVASVHEGTWLGATSKKITDVVNIGIGGSDLGPHMACEALEPYWHSRITPHFVSNVDGAHLGRTLKSLPPETTLFVVVSKTFTTQETLSNARTARDFIVGALGPDAVAKHFVAVSTNAKEVTAFGIDAQNMFAFWDWVGGRYSLWSAVGITAALAIGMDRFEELLSGAYEMDQHFQSAPLAENLPVIMALLGVWYSNYWGAESFAVLPYDQSLHRFAAWLQQGDMESNGKSVSRGGKRLPENSGPIVWGEPGTNGQHAFYQLLHQGTRLVPCDFVIAEKSHYPIGVGGKNEQHKMLLANALAQSEALMVGKNRAAVDMELNVRGLTSAEIENAAPHRVFEGSRPSNLIGVKSLTPHSLGALLALYEHRIFVQGVIWDVNSFDQWGVELGKKLALDILDELYGGAVRQHDASTASWIRRFSSNEK